MIVIGVDVHKLSLTAVVVDEVGRPVAELTVGSSAELVAWSGSLEPERLWAVEDCRQLTGALERRLVAAGESLVRVPPNLMAPERRAGRARGNSDPIDALAVRAATPTRSTRWPSLGRLCVSRGSIVHGRVRRRCASRSCSSIIATIWSTSVGGPSSGCAGSCTTSIRSSRSRRARSTVRSGSTVSPVGCVAPSRRCRSGSRASTSAAAAA
jgi:hypothetical protein